MIWPKQTNLGHVSNDRGQSVLDSILLSAVVASRFRQQRRSGRVVNFIVHPKRKVSFSLLAFQPASHRLSPAQRTGQSSLIFGGVEPQFHGQVTRSQSHGTALTGWFYLRCTDVVITVLSLVVSSIT